MAPSVDVYKDNSSSNNSNINNNIIGDKPTSILSSIASQLPDNEIYTQHFPKFIIGLAVLYGLTFFTRHLIRRLRRFRDKKQHQEKRRLRQAWKSSIIKYQLKESLSLSNNNDDDDVEEKSIIEYPPMTYKEYDYNYSASSLTIADSPSPSKTVIVSFADNSRRLSNSSENSCCKSNNSSITIEALPSKGSFVNNISKHSTVKHREYPYKFNIVSKRFYNFWKMSKAKRLNLLWHWSVSTGYLEYDHAKHLSALMSQLYKNQELGFEDEEEKETEEEDSMTIEEEEGFFEPVTVLCQQ